MRVLSCLLPTEGIRILTGHSPTKLSRDASPGSDFRLCLWDSRVCMDPRALLLNASCKTPIWKPPKRKVTKEHRGSETTKGSLCAFGMFNIPCFWPSHHLQPWSAIPGNGAHLSFSSDCIYQQLSDPGQAEGEAPESKNFCFFQQFYCCCCSTYI